MSKNWHGFCRARFEGEFGAVTGKEQLAVCLDESEDAVVRSRPDCAHCPVAQRRVEYFYKNMFAPGCPTPFDLPVGIRGPGFEMVVPEGLKKTYIVNIKRLGAEHSSYKLGVRKGFVFIRDVRWINGAN